MTLEERLRALASDDETRVPARLDAAIMAAWDAHRGHTPAPPRRRWPLWVAACAGVVLAVILLAPRFTPVELDAGPA